MKILLLIYGIITIIGFIIMLYEVKNAPEVPADFEDFKKGCDEFNKQIIQSKEKIYSLLDKIK